MATYGDIQSEVAQKVDETYLTSQISTAINRTILFYQPYHFWFNTATASITLIPNDPIVPNIPDDFQYEMTKGGLVINNSSMRYVLQRVHEVEYDCQNVQGIGLPFNYCYRNGQFELYWYPDQAYTLYLYYVRKYPDLVESNDTNDWTDNATRLIVAQTLADLYLDQRKSKDYYDFYRSVAASELAELKQRNKRNSGTGMLIPDNGLLSTGSSYNRGIYYYY